MSESEEDKVYVVRLLTEYDSSGPAKLSHAKVCWGEEKITVVIAGGEEGAFKFVVTKKELNELGKKLRVSDSDMEKWAIEAFQTSSHNYLLSIDHRRDEIAWKRTGSEDKKQPGDDNVTKKNMKLRLGKFSFTTLADPLTVHSEILEDAVREGERARSQLADLRDRQNRLLDELKEARFRLGEFSEVKSELEQTMLARFLPVLHSKQDKIAQLQVELQKVKRGKRDVVDEESYGSDTDIDEETPSKEPRMSGHDSTADDSQNFLKI